MRAIIRLRAIGCCVGLVLLASAPIGWAEELPKPLVGLAPASGIVTGMVGGPQRIETGAAPTLLKIGDKIGGGDELRLGPGETVDVLWDRRAVITLQEEARVHISEPRHGQTELHLHQGAVRIVLSYSAGRMTDTLTVQTPLARVISRGGILEASTVGGEQRSLLARLVNAATVDTLRVFEGQARVEPLTGQGKPFSLKTGSEVSLKPEAVGEVSEEAATIGRRCHSLRGRNIAACRIRSLSRLPMLKSVLRWNWNRGSGRSLRQKTGKSCREVASRA